MRSTAWLVLESLLLGALSLAQSNSVPLSNHNAAANSQSASPAHTMAFEQFATRPFKHVGMKSESQTGLSFTPGVDYGSGGFLADSVAVADLNGDHNLDIAVANCGLSGTVGCSEGAAITIGVLLGKGNGTFQTAVTYGSGGYASATVTLSTAIAIADVNGDGKPDLIVANPCANSTCSGNGSVSVLLGNGDGTFQTAVTYGSGGVETDSVAVADMNGDGKLDIVVSNNCSNASSCPGEIPPAGSVSVLLGNGNGTFQTPVVYDTELAYSVALGDVNGDGSPDVVVATCAGPVFGCAPGGVSVLLNNGDGTLQSPVTYSSGGDAPVALALADLNGDGKLDVAVTNQLSNASLNGPPEIGVLLGNGDGTFQSAVTYSGNLVLAGVAIADVNEDGKADLVVNGASCMGAASVAVLLGNGDGTFQPAVGFCYPGSNPSGPSVAVGDVNGDGRLDLVAPGCNSGCSSGLVGVLLNTSGQGFSLAASPASLTLAGRQAGTSTLTISPVSGFAQPIALSCSGAPPQATCTVTPHSVTLNGSSSATAQVAIITGAESATLLHPAGFPPASQFALWLAFSGLSGLVLLRGRPSRSRKRHGRLLQGLVLTCMLSLALTWSACGGGSGSSGSPGTPPGTYSLTLTGTYTANGASLTQTATLTLVVQ